MLSKNELLRYQRQIGITPWGKAGQKRLKKLVLANNMITYLPDLSEFELLAYLDISNNPLNAPAFATIKPQVPLLKIYKF